MKIISFCSIKGGVGKSTLNILCSRYLSSVGYKVLCIDCDVQNSLTFYFLNNPDFIENKNIFHAIKNENIIDNIIDISDRISIIPSHLDLRKIDYVDKNLFNVLVKKIANKFDFLLIDCSPCFNSLTISICQSSDLVINPLFLGQFEWKSSLLLKKELSIHLGKSDNLKFLINKFSETKLTKKNHIILQYLELLEKSFGKSIIKTTIPDIRNMTKLIDTETKIRKNIVFERLFTAIQKLVNEIFGIMKIPKEF